MIRPLRGIQGICKVVRVGTPAFLVYCIWLAYYCLRSGAEFVRTANTATAVRTVGRLRPIENPYQSPTAENEPQTELEPAAKPSFLGRIIGLSFFALLFGGNGIRIVPGGPFISLMFDILPTVAAVVSLWYSFLTLREQSTTAKIIALFFMLVCILALSNVFRSVLSFWFRPSARGDFFGL